MKQKLPFIALILFGASLLTIDIYSNRAAIFGGDPIAFAFNMKLNTPDHFSAVQPVSPAKYMK